MFSQHFAQNSTLDEGHIKLAQYSRSFDSGAKGLQFDSWSLHVTCGAGVVDDKHLAVSSNQGNACTPTMGIRGEQ